MLAQSSRFEPYEDIFELADKAEQVLSLCNTMGEGWLLTAEMVDLIEHGTPNIVCAQPFACLPNHVVGKSVIKRLRQMHPESNIVAVDYDPGASEVNQLNRIKLMISVAKENYRNDHERGFRLENPNDPTVNDAVAPYVDESRYHHDSIVNEGGVGHGAPAIHLSDEQLAQIEDAKPRAAGLPSPAFFLRGTLEPIERRHTIGPEPVSRTGRYTFGRRMCTLSPHNRARTCIPHRSIQVRVPNV